MTPTSTTSPDLDVDDLDLIEETEPELEAPAEPADEAVDEQPAHEPEPPAARTVSILLVCTGNVGRSPYMELVLRKLLGDAGLDQLQVASAGTNAIPHMGVHRLVAEELTRRGIDATEFRTQPLTRELVAGSSLIITAARSHRDQAGRLVPAKRDRMFTLLQLQRLIAAGLEPGPADEEATTAVELLAARANANRGRAGVSSQRDDVPDPMGGGTRAFQSMFNLIDQPLTALASTLLELDRRSDRGESSNA